MTDVTDEMVANGKAAILAQVPFGYGMTEAEAENYARAALSAALPLVVAGERERAAKIAENCEDKFFDIGDKRAALDKPAYWHAAKVVAANAIAAVIRADTGGET